MFPRLHKVVRLALLALLFLFLLLVLLRSGGPESSMTAVHPDPPPNLLISRRVAFGLQQLLPAHQTQHHLQRQQQQEQRVPAVTTLQPVGQTHPKPKEDDITRKASAVANPHLFRYILNPERACVTHDGTPVRLLVYVHAAPANLKKRQSIRQTWGDQDLLRRHNATLVFIMGSVSDQHLMALVGMESERYGDIVQEDFVDSYRNLTYKAIAGLKWAASFCSRATYILKTDDDILVNWYRLLDYVHKVVEPQYGGQGLILCNQWLRMKIIREKKSKWYIPEEDFPGEYFPPYCSGSAFLLSGDMAQAMYEASLETPFFWVDDYYITGALIKRLGVQHRRLNTAYILNPSVAEGKFRNDTKHELMFFHLHNLGLLYRLWKNMTMEYENSRKAEVTSPLHKPSRAHA